MRMRLVTLLLCLAAWTAAARAEDGDMIAGRTQAQWRDEMASLEREVERAEQAVEACEAREAPAAYDGIDAVIERDRHGRLRGVELLRCDDERLDLAALRAAIEDFEDGARRSGVPPGWLR
jgi:hypothetical protein